MKTRIQCLNAVHGGGYITPESTVTKLSPLEPLCQSPIQGSGQTDNYTEESLDWEE